LGQMPHTHYEILCTVKQITELHGVSNIAKGNGKSTDNGWG
jgi:hypothetical protein